MNREQIVEKVKKLYALSGNNPSANEATAAAALAQRLMHKYHIEELELAETAEELVESEFKTGKGNKWKYMLSATVAKNFRTKCYWYGREKVRFYGQATDVEIAKSTYEFLFNLCVSLSRKADYQERKRTGSSNGAGVAFALGFAKGVAEELGKQCTALMVITPKEVEEGYEKMREERGMHTMNNHCRYNNSQAKQYEDGIFAGKSAIGRKNIETN